MAEMLKKPAFWLFVAIGAAVAFVIWQQSEKKSEKKEETTQATN